MEALRGLFAEIEGSDVQGAGAQQLFQWLLMWCQWRSSMKAMEGSRGLFAEIEGSGVQGAGAQQLFQWLLMWCQWRWSHWKIRTGMESRYHYKKESKCLMRCKEISGMSWGLQREGLIRTWEGSHWARDTGWGLQGEGQVRTLKESGVRGTHPLGAAEGGTCQDTKWKGWGGGHSPRLQREGHIRTPKKWPHEQHLQVTETKEGGTYHDMEGKELTERRRKEEGKEGRQCFGGQGWG